MRQMCIMSWQMLPVQGLVLSGPDSQAACRGSVGMPWAGPWAGREGRRVRKGEEKEGKNNEKELGKKNLDL